MLPPAQLTPAQDLLATIERVNKERAEAEAGAAPAAGKQESGEED